MRELGRLRAVNKKVEVVLVLFREYPVLEALTIVCVRWVQLVDSKGFCERVLARCLARSDSVKSALHDSLHNSTDLTYLSKRDSTRLYLARLVITTVSSTREWLAERSQWSS